jgi:fucose 4-O-acetylase-like acetyltransferase
MPSDATSDRNGGLDVARGLGMILVIYGHLLQIFFHKRADGEFSTSAFLQWQAIYSFHMPLFFLISGAVVTQFSGKSWKETASRSAYFIVLAYSIDALGILFAACVQGVSSPTIPTLKDYLVDHLLLAEAFSTITPWFLIAFALVRLVAYALTRAEGAKRWCILALLGIVFAASYRWPQAFHMRAVPPGVLFFMMGRYFATYNIHLNTSIAVVFLASALWLAHYNSGCTVAWQSSCENPELPGHFAVLMIFGLVGSLPLFLVTAAMGGIGIMSLGGPLGRTWVSRPIRLIGENSVDFLLINGFFLVFANPYLRDRVEINDTPAFFILAALLVTLAHLAAFLALKRALSHVKACAQSLGRLIADAIWSVSERVFGARSAAA